MLLNKNYDENVISNSGVKSITQSANNLKENELWSFFI